jgi:hypothetical protein
MRTRRALGLAFVLLAVAPFSACKLLHKAGADAGADGSTDGAAAEAPSSPEAPAESAPSASASTPAHAVARPMGPPAAGNPCATKDVLACATDGFEELTCSGTVWHVLQTCRGPGACKTENGIVKCDPGVPRAGDACVVTSAVPRCLDPRSVLQCENGRWVSSLCLPPAKCLPNAKNGQAGCK